MTNKCLVTGASSQIGDVLLGLLPGKFSSVLACSRQPQAEGTAVEWIQADLAAGCVLPADVDCLIHLAPLTLLGALLEQATRPLRVIGISTCSVLHKAQSSSAAERKLAQEFLVAEEKVVEVAERKGHQLTLLRPTMLYGNGRDATISVLQSFALRYGFLVVPGGAPGLRQPVHVADVAAAIVQCSEQEKTLGKTYELGGKSQMTLRQMCEKILLDNGKRPRVIGLPLWPLKLVIQTLRALKIRPDWDVALLQRAWQNQTVDNRRAIHDFGYAPRAFDGSHL